MYEQIQDKASAVKFAKQLRDTAERSEHEFIRFLMWLEGHGDIWDSAKYRSFSEFLTFESLCAASRFNNGKRALAELGGEVVEKIGMTAAVQVIRLPEKSAERTKAVEACTTFRNANEVYPSERTTRNIVSSLGWKIAAPRDATSPKHKVQELEEENAALRKRVKELERQVKKLEKENGKLRATKKAA